MSNETNNTNSWIVIPVEQFQASYNARLQPSYAAFIKEKDCQTVTTKAGKTFTIGICAIDPLSKDATTHFCGDGMLVSEGNTIGEHPEFVYIYEYHGHRVKDNRVTMHGHEEIIEFELDDIANTLDVMQTR